MTDMKEPTTLIVWMEPVEDRCHIFNVPTRLVTDDVKAAFSGSMCCDLSKAYNYANMWAREDWCHNEYGGFSLTATPAIVWRPRGVCPCEFRQNCSCANPIPDVQSCRYVACEYCE